jgi:hypothetical protein
MPKELGDDHIRVTVRLPQPLYDELCAIRRARYGWGSGNIGTLIRYALLHYLDCPERLRPEDEHDAYMQWLAAHQQPPTVHPHVTPARQSRGTPGAGAGAVSGG